MTTHGSASFISVAVPVSDRGRPSDAGGYSSMPAWTESGKVPLTPEELSKEVSRILNLKQQLSKALADQETALSVSMRLANWSKQLEAYLQGLRFALGETERFREHELCSLIEGINNERTGNH